MKRYPAVLGAGLAASLLLATSVQANTIYSWENDANGFGNISEFSTTVGVTDGTYSAGFDVPAGFSWAMPTGNWAPAFAALNAAHQAGGTTFLLDVTGPNEDSGAGVLAVGIWVWFDNDTQTADLGAYQIPTDGTTNTYTFDFSSIAGPSFEWIQLRISANTTEGYDPGTVYVDNLRIIPEPASLALAAVGGGWVLLRRRRGSRLPAG